MASTPTRQKRPTTISSILPTSLPATPTPATDVVPVPYQDNADQTNFWADFIASSNTLGAQAEQLVATGNSHQIKAFIHTLQGWENNVSNFDAGQGGIFEARFDNELLGKNSTVGADVAE